MPAPEAKKGVRVPVVLQVSLSPLRVDRGTELSVVLSVWVRDELSTLKTAEFLGGLLIEECERGRWTALEGTKSGDQGGMCGGKACTALRDGSCLKRKRCAAAAFAKKEECVF